MEIQLLISKHKCSIDHGKDFTPISIDRHEANKFLFESLFNITKKIIQSQTSTLYILKF